MSANPRKKRGLKKKIIIYLLFLIFLSGLGAAFLLYFNFSSQNILLISPLAKGDLSTKTLEKSLEKNNIPFSSIEKESDVSYKINIANNGEVIVSASKNIDQQTSSLQRILRELTIEGKPFKSIDLRFNEPIISF